MICAMAAILSRGDELMMVTMILLIMWKKQKELIKLGMWSTFDVYVNVQIRFSLNKNPIIIKFPNELQ